MYRRHKIACVALSLLTFFAAFILKADYSKIAEAAISVVSIALAVYIGAASVILGSNFADKLKKQKDSQIKTKTSLGVLATYLRLAGICGLLTLIISVVYLIGLDISSLGNTLAQWGQIGYLPLFQHLFSAISCSLFVINIFYIWLILIFLINSMTKSV